MRINHDGQLRRNSNPHDVTGHKINNPDTFYFLTFKGGYTLVTLPRIVTPYRDSVDETRARVTYQKLVTR